MDCVVCRIVAGQEPADIVFEDAELLAFLDLAPLNPGHLLLAPKQHYSSIAAVPQAVRARLLELGPALAKAVLRATDADGYNLLIANGSCAGQLIAHTFMQIIPRHPHDGLVLPARAVPYGSAIAKHDLLAAIKARLKP